MLYDDGHCWSPLVTVQGADCALVQHTPETRAPSQRAKAYSSSSPSSASRLSTSSASMTSGAGPCKPKGTHHTQGCNIVQHTQTRTEVPHMMYSSNAEVHKIQPAKLPPFKALMLCLQAPTVTHLPNKVHINRQNSHMVLVSYLYIFFTKTFMMCTLITCTLTTTSNSCHHSGVTSH